MCYRHLRTLVAGLNADRVHRVPINLFGEPEEQSMPHSVVF
jgi:hypothetical protein